MYMRTKWNGLRSTRPEAPDLGGFLHSLGFRFGIEVVKNAEGACLFGIVLMWGGEAPL